MRIPSTPINLIAGDDKYLDFTIESTSGVATDISTITGATFQISKPNDVYANIKKTLGSGVSFLTDGSDGVLRVTVLDTDTTKLCGTYRYKMEIADSGGLKTTVAAGPVTFREDITT